MPLSPLFLTGCSFDTTSPQPLPSPSFLVPSPMPTSRAPTTVFAVTCRAHRYASHLEPERVAQRAKHRDTQRTAAVEHGWLDPGVRSHSQQPLHGPYRRQQQLQE